jgi:molybdenum cofactor guanylyltransferase
MFYILLMDNNNILPVVLAGGKSKRFGENKSQALLGDKMLIDYILSEITSDFKEILIVANDPINHLLSNKIVRINDSKKNFGPLGGVFSAMKWIKDNHKDYRWIATFPSDTPFFKINIFNNFINMIQEKESELFIIKFNEKRHNIFGMWSIDLIDRLEKDLENGARKVEIWAEKIGVKTINMSFEKGDPFFNINTKEDLEKAKKILND